jgi:hypothetical protein
MFHVDETGNFSFHVLELALKKLAPSAIIERITTSSNAK